MTELAGKTLTCLDCGRPFAFSAGEQQFFAQRGFEEPKRCKECRLAKKERREHGGR